MVPALQPGDGTTAPAIRRIPNGLKTDYLWKQVLTRGGLTDIIENYAQLLETRDDKTGRKKRQQIWPRYHQLDVVRMLLEDVSSKGVGPKYLIQHSAGSGKSNSIAWLGHQLTGLERDNEVVFDTVLIVTDRRLLDKQIRDTIKQFAQVGSIVGHAEDSGHLRQTAPGGESGSSSPRSRSSRSSLTPLATSTGAASSP